MDHFFPLLIYTLYTPGFSKNQHINNYILT